MISYRLSNRSHQQTTLPTVPLEKPSKFALVATWASGLIPTSKPLPTSLGALCDYIDQLH
ncbi:MAG: hypothetical protein KUG79_14030 [Pseudomonadales bacterium]|nr:hypothetical protein [Pseudomonadales bacterium]